MTESQPIAAIPWDDADALIEHFEQVVRGRIVSDSLLDEWISQLRGLTNAQSVCLIAATGSNHQTLARSGVSIGSSLEPSDHDDGRLITHRDLGDDHRLGLEIRFDQPIPPALRRSLVDLSEAFIDHAVVIHLRQQVSRLNRHLTMIADKDQRIGQMYEGRSAQQCCQNIVTQVVNMTGADRVSLLQHSLDSTEPDGDGILGNRLQRPKLFATSASPQIDRRSRHVRLLEDTVANFSQATSLDSVPIQAYQAESGSQDIHIETIANTGMVIVLENFSEHAEPTSMATAYEPFRSTVEHAVGVAVSRDQIDWRNMGQRLLWRIRSSGTGVFLIATCLTVAAATLIRVPLNLSAPGRVVAVDQQHIYATANGIIDSLLVGDGDRVTAGTPLARLRSPELDLRQRTVEGDLATARSQLDSLRVGRGDRNPNQSTQENILKAQIAGLESQLTLIQQQQAALIVASPMDGQVDRWNLRSVLSDRPVAVGQYLMSIVSETSGWKVDLEIPDKHVGYVLERQKQQPCSVALRLRSDSTTVHHSQIDSISDSAHVNGDGNSIVRASVPLATNEGVSVHDGASVIARIDCGNHPLGFVYLRGLIEWWRGSTWM